MTTELFFPPILYTNRVPFIQEVSGVYTCLSLNTDYTKNGFSGPKSFWGFRETGPYGYTDVRFSVHNITLSQPRETTTTIGGTHNINSFICTQNLHISLTKIKFSLGLTKN